MRPQNLPIFAKRDEIVEAVRSKQCVVVCGATGSGKTTQLPQLLLAAGLGKHGMIGHTQPRRIAARSVAQRIAQEMGEKLGEGVGVQVRFDDRTSKNTRIKLMTDGIALAELVRDPLLRNYDAMIVDEAHERSLNIDLLLASLRLVIRKRPEFRVVITSATIEPKRFCEYFGGIAACPLVEVSGRSFPIRTVYHEPRSCEDGELASPAEIADAVEEVRLQLEQTDGPQDVLVFVPGEREIRSASAAILQRGSDAEVLPLYARLSSAEQDRVFATSKRARVIIATNVAETSLTLPAIGGVVDTGVARISRYDTQRRVGTLPLEPVSRASCDQRAGRCGRVAPGVCVRLYSEASYRSRDVVTPAEVLRTNLAGLVLRVRTLPTQMLEAPCERSGLPVSLLEPPSSDAVMEAMTTLFELHATTQASAEGEITAIGRALARMPVDPRIGRMLLAARGLSCTAEVLILAAGLSLQDPRERPMGKQDEADRAHGVFRHQSSDFLSLLKLYDQFEHAAREGKDDVHVGSGPEWCRRHFVSYARMREWRELVHQLRENLEEVQEEHALDDVLGSDAAANLAVPAEEAIHRALLTGLIATIACREGEAGSGTYRSIRGQVAKVFPGSVLFKSNAQWIMAAEIVQTSQLFARTVAKIDVRWIKEQAGHLFRTIVSDPHVDEAGEPCGWQRVTLGSIVVTPRERVKLAGVDAAKARGVFISQVLACSDAFVREGETSTSGLAAHAFMQHNAALLRRAMAAQAKLRRRDVLADVSQRAAFFERVLPPDVCDGHSLLSALAADARVQGAGPKGAGLQEKLRLKEEDCLTQSAKRALDEELFPSSLALARGVIAEVRYAFAPGKEEDGVTFVLPLLALAEVSDDAFAWLVPGMRSELFGAMLKSLPKAARAEIERSAGASIDDAAAQLAELAKEDSPPARGVERAPADVLASVLRDGLGVHVTKEQFAMQGLPAHLRPRVVIVQDDAMDVVLGESKDLAQLRQRLASKLAAAKKARASATHDVAGLRAWGDFELGSESEAEQRSEDGANAGYLTLMDEGESVRLTRVKDAGQAEAQTRFGVRRLLAIACADELSHAVACVDMAGLVKAYGALGSAEELRDAVQLHTVDKAMLFQQSVPRTREEFATRVLEGQGKLMVSVRDVADVIARTLEARSKVAHRLGSGTNRTWATSIADVREHAAYLMPVGFLHMLTWQRLRDYPKYAETMRARLFALREDGSGVEKDALALVQPRWKLLTAWAARSMSEQRRSEEESRESGTATGQAKQGKDVLTKGAAPKHQARRGAPVVNVDAGVFAMSPRNAWQIEQARWLLEDLRAAVFAGLAAPSGVQLAVQHAKLIAKVDDAWRSVGG